MKILEKFVILSALYGAFGASVSPLSAAEGDGSSKAWDFLNRVADRYLFQDKKSEGAEAQTTASKEAPPPPSSASTSDAPPPPPSAPAVTTSTPAAPLAVATPAVQASTPVVAAPVASTVSAKRYLGQLFVDLPRKQPWAMVKSGSFAGHCVYPTLLDMNGKVVSPQDQYQWQYFRNITGLVQFEPDRNHSGRPAIYSGSNLDTPFLEWLKARGCHSEDGRKATIYKATMMIDLDVVQPELKETEIEAQLVQLSSIKGYVLGVITRIGDHPDLRGLVGMCVDFEEIYRSDGTPIPAYDIHTFTRKTIRGFLSLDPRTKRFVQIQKTIDGIDPRNLMRAAVRDGACKDSGTTYKIRMLQNGWVVDAAKLVEWIHPYKKP